MSETQPPTAPVITSGLNEAARIELERLENEAGALRARDVLDAARNPESALHEYFTWDDTEAAHRWRTEQANNLIRRFTVRLVTSDAQPVKMRGYVSLTPDRIPGGGVYRSLATVMSSEQLMRQMVRDALRDLAAVKNKYRAVKALDVVWERIDAAAAEYADAGGAEASAV
mgnify:CR=1 FL=1